MIYNVIPSKIQPRHIKDDGTLAKNTLSIWDWGSHMLDRLHEMFLVSTWRTDGVSHVVQRLEEVVEKRVPKNARASQGVYNSMFCTLSLSEEYLTLRSRSTSVHDRRRRLGGHEALPESLAQAAPDTQLRCQPGSHDSEALHYCSAPIQSKHEQSARRQSPKTNR